MPSRPDRARKFRGRVEPAGTCGRGGANWYPSQYPIMIPAGPLASVVWADWHGDSGGWPRSARRLMEWTPLDGPSRVRPGRGPGHGVNGVDQPIGQRAVGDIFRLTGPRASVRAERTGATRPARRPAGGEMTVSGDRGPRGAGHARPRPDDGRRNSVACWPTDGELTVSGDRGSRGAGHARPAQTTVARTARPAGRLTVS